MSKLGIDKYTDNNVFDQFIANNLGDIADKYKNIKLPSEIKDIPNIIWVFWWQGEDAMPEVVKECYTSIIRNSNGREVRLLTDNNYKEYVKLPCFIELKFKSGKIGFTHFSDIIRTYLLKEYGGLWIDAAIFVTKPIILYDGLFYSPRLDLEKHQSPHMSQWVMGVMGAAPAFPLFSYIYDLLIEYWKKFDVVFSYLMYDYYIKYGYNHISWIKQIIDERPITSPDLHSSRYTFNQEVDENKLDKLIRNNTFLSLTYRIPYPLVLENGKETYYSALLRKCRPRQ